MKKLIFALVAISLIAGVGFAFDEAVMPQHQGRFFNLKGTNLPLNVKAPGAPDTVTHTNVYLLGSMNRGVTYDLWNKFTSFDKYTRDGLGAMGESNILVLGNQPHVAFNGWDDVAGTWKMWFYSPGTGIKEVYSGATFAGWQSIGYSQAANTLYICWGDFYFGGLGSENAMEGDIFISSSADGGNTWGAPVNISDFIQATTPNDSAQEYPKIAPKVGNAIHLFYLDDSKLPGSSIQGIGVATDAPIRYCQVNPNLSGLLYGPVAGGVTAYDWATTGNTEGIVTDAAENAIWVWTKMDTLWSFRLIGWNAYTGVAPDPVGYTVGSNWIGFPGITIDANGLPIVCWHHAGRNASISCVDEGGIGGGLWTTPDTMSKDSRGFIWPSITVSGTGDTICMVGAQSNLGAEARRYDNAMFGTEIGYGNGKFYDTTSVPWADARYQYIGVYVGIGADPSSQMVWGCFEADTGITRFPPSNLIITTVGPDTFDLDWFASGDAEVDSYFVYRNPDTAATWNDKYPFANTSWTRIGITDAVTLTFTDVPPLPASGYKYAVTAIVKTPDYEYESGAATGYVVGVEELPKPVAELPKSFFLAQTHPNPTSGKCNIEYALPNPCRVSLKVYNLAGQLVKTLVDRHESAGYKTARWNGTDDKGARVSNGIYFYQLNAGNFSSTKRMMIVR
ncbi:MAG: FlgD immunoglobulin-like domain containing protein [Candidatus Edwardsbacteria bacterium]